MDSRHPLVREETPRLERTFAEIARQRAAIGPVYKGQDFLEQVLEARREETRQRIAVLEKEPYFGRLDFRAADRDEPTPLYIGKRGIDLQETNEPYVIDWRAPVASLFYSFTGGDAPVSYEAPEGTIDGEIHRKRNLSIRDRELERVVESYVRGGDNIGLSDEFLLYRLGDKKDNRLRDIVSTIQAEQDAIIRAGRNKALIIQGAAGSGKTTVALHRLAFLLYRYREQVRAERMIIFAPNTMFLDYISGVLPELGVGNVRQTTFADWALELLDANLKLIAESSATDGGWFAPADERPAIDGDTPGRFKGSLAFRDLVDERVRNSEAAFLDGRPFEPWEGLKLSGEQIREWFATDYRHYPLAIRRERLEARINRWLEMQLKTIGDAKIRKERAKTGKQRLRAFAAKLPRTDALSVYAGLFAPAAERAAAIPAAIAEQTRADLAKSRIRPEDLAPLVWIRRSLYGPGEGGSFDHVVVDEAQDVSPFQIALLRSFMNEPSFTILGDLAQGIHAYRGVLRWEELAEAFPDDRSSYHALRQSYRSTLEIIEFANRILPYTETGLTPAQPVFRSGDPVELVPLGKEAERLPRITAFIRDNLARGMRTIAIIGRTEKMCAQLHAQLEREGFAAHLIAEGQSRYFGGITVVPAHLAKGLEFDAVLVADTGPGQYGRNAQDAKLLYVACTRALHRLALLTGPQPPPQAKGGSVTREDSSLISLIAPQPQP